MDKNLIYIIIILCIITITIYIKKYYLNKEGIGNPFTFILKLFNTIGVAITSIFTLFGLVGDIFGMINCPYKIWSNIGKCLYLWFLDWLFSVLFWIWFLLLWVTVFLPISIGWFVICLTMGDLLYACNVINAYDICPSRTNFFKYIDYLYFLISGKFFLLRSKRDISDCYCFPPLKFALGPLEHKLDLKPFSKKEKEEKETSYLGVLILIAILIMISLVILFISKEYQNSVSSAKKILTDSAKIPTGPGVGGLPPVPGVLPPIPGVVVPGGLPPGMTTGMPKTGMTMNPNPLFK